MKRKSYLMLLTVLFLVYGCAKNDVDNVESAQDIVSTEKTIEPTEDVQEETVSGDEQENEPENASDGENIQYTKEKIAAYMERWAEYLEPTMTTEELEQLGQIEWDEKIRPYMEYDWIGDERIERWETSSNLWEMQLADLNMDGQPEMLVSEHFYSFNDLLHIYTLKEGEVVYCGEIIGGDVSEENQYYGGSSYLPSYYIDVYQNNAGEFRYLSAEEFSRSEGHYYIYESTLNEVGISYRPVYEIRYGYDIDGNKHYYYTIGKYQEEGDNIPDDENYTAFNQAMKEYMEGYEKVDIDFVVSGYYVPTLAGELPEEQQEIVRNNIIFGFAQALGYMDK